MLDYLRPDGKAQVTVEYIDDQPNRIDTVLVSTQHTEGVSQETIKGNLTEELIKKVIPEEYMDEKLKF